MKVTRETDKITVEFGVDDLNHLFDDCLNDYLKSLEKTQDMIYALMSKGIEKAPRNKFEGVKITERADDTELEKMDELDLGLGQEDLK